MNNNFSISKLELALIVGIIGCLLLATWEFMNLASTEWFVDWVRKDKFTNRRIIHYGTGFVFSSAAILVAIRTINKESRFIYALNRALLWYGSLLLISTIAIFVFDCLPEIFAGIIGAGVFAYTIYFLQKKFFSEERVKAMRTHRNQCLSCGFDVNHVKDYCGNCGNYLKKDCGHCQSKNSVASSFCTGCGKAF